ncbi:hypothetical protein [Gaoshiqia sp. Z1-71]|uniref:hypothetical protein n=1 Tax=Gaoshiqia hydrogeniformans TaxID=3290090 RepID=UPI003BF80A70
MKTMKMQGIGILMIGMALGTAWAVRGQFGHEQGAAWAGGIGALALVLVSRREDWYQKALLIALASAVGWGMGGMISYGKIVGYGRADDFLNASYGLLMLFVIGGLYGLLGGGLTGLSLSSSKQKKVEWTALIAEMAAGGLIAYYLLVHQLEIWMTPPRSEAWAVCLGGGAALIWFMARHKHISALRVAFYSAIGAGFGFAFGNFLQILGNVLEIQFNMWNVMEYSIGFFGGSSMAYGVFSSRWPEESESVAPKKWENRTAFLLVFVLIPLIVFQQSSSLSDPLFNRPATGSDPGKVTFIGSLAAFAVLAAMIRFSWSKSLSGEIRIGEKPVTRLFAGSFMAYILFSYLVSGAFSGVFLFNHHLYIVNFVLIIYLLSRRIPVSFKISQPEINGQVWMKILIVSILLVFMLALILINIHGEMTGSQLRFS